MMSSKGNIFCVTGPLCKEFSSHRWIPLTKASDVELLMFSLICAWTNGWVNNRDRDDSWWRHQMETFSALLAICAENSPVPGEFSTQRPVTRSFDVYFDLRPNKGLSKQLWGWWFETQSCPLWRHRNVELPLHTLRHHLKFTKDLESQHIYHFRAHRPQMIERYYSDITWVLWCLKSNLSNSLFRLSPITNLQAKTLLHQMSMLQILNFPRENLYAETHICDILLYDIIGWCYAPDILWKLEMLSFWLNFSD